MFSPKDMNRVFGNIVDSDQDTLPESNAPANGRIAALYATRCVVETKLLQAVQEVRAVMARSDANTERTALRKAERKLGRVTKIRGQLSIMLYGTDLTTNARAMEEVRDQVEELRDDYEDWLEQSPGANAQLNAHPPGVNVVLNAHPSIHQTSSFQFAANTPVPRRTEHLMQAMLPKVELLSVVSTPSGQAGGVYTVC